MSKVARLVGGKALVEVARFDYHPIMGLKKCDALNKS